MSNFTKIPTEYNGNNDYFNPLCTGPAFRSVMLREAIENNDETFVEKFDAKQKEIIEKAEDQSNDILLIHSSRMYGTSTTLLWIAIEHAWAGLNVAFVARTNDQLYGSLKLFPKDKTKAGKVSLSFSGGIMFGSTQRTFIGQSIDLWIFDNPDPKSDSQNSYGSWVSQFNLKQTRRILAFTPDTANSAAAWNSVVTTQYFKTIHPDRYIIAPWWHKLNRPYIDTNKEIQEMKAMEKMIGEWNFHMYYCCDFGENIKTIHNDGILLK